jgi:lysophospholipase L1-like esterase
VSRLLLVLLATGAALLGAEALSRYLAPTEFMKPIAGDEAGREIMHRRSDIPGLAYELRPGAEMRIGPDHLVRTNAAGMRGAEIPQGPADCTIAVLGDSYTFGFAVDQRQVWPAVLEQRLREALPARVVRVLNMAVTGYSTRDEVLAFRHKGLGFEPDLVIIGYVLNDPETLYPWAAAPLHFQEPALWQHSNLLRLAALAVRTTRIRAHGGSLVRFLHAPDGAGWRSVEEGFGDIAALAREHGFRALVAILPMVDGPDWGTYRFRDIHEQVARLAVQNGIEVLDLLEAWQRYPVVKLVVSPQDVQPSAVGHRVTAEAVAGRVLAAELAGPGCATPVADSQHRDRAR